MNDLLLENIVEQLNEHVKKIETLEQRVAGLTEAVLTLSKGRLCMECYQILEDSEEHWHKNG